MAADAYANGDYDALQCCGDHQMGQFFNQNEQTCCATGHMFWDENLQANTTYQLYDVATGSGHLQCCHNGFNTPQLFNTTFQMCCAGIVNYSALES